MKKKNFTCKVSTLLHAIQLRTYTGNVEQCSTSWCIPLKGFCICISLCFHVRSQTTTDYWHIKWNNTAPHESSKTHLFYQVNNKPRLAAIHLWHSRQSLNQVKSSFTLSDVKVNHTCGDDPQLWNNEAALGLEGSVLTIYLFTHLWKYM